MRQRPRREQGHPICAWEPPAASHNVQQCPRVPPAHRRASIPMSNACLHAHLPVFSWRGLCQHGGEAAGRTHAAPESPMGIEIIDPKEIALRERKRTVVMNTRKLHAWVHYYPNPGDHDELHCHNEDQVFTCFEGECTMRFPDG